MVDNEIVENDANPIIIDTEVQAFGQKIKMNFVIEDGLVVMSTNPVNFARMFYNAEKVAASITGKPAGMVYVERRQKCFTRYPGKTKKEVFEIIASEIKKLKEGGKKL